MENLRMKSLETKPNIKGNEEREEEKSSLLERSNINVKSQYETAFINRLFYNYMIEAFKLSNYRHKQNLALNENDIFTLPNNIKLKDIVERFMILFKQKHSIIRALLASFGYDGLITIILILVQTVCSIINPLLLNLIIIYISEDRNELSLEGDSKAYGYFLSFLLISMLVFKVFIGSFALQKEKLLQVKTQIAIYGSIFSKIIKISNAAKSMFQFGEIIVLISSDSQVVIEFPNMLNVIISSPVFIVLTLITMYIQLGWCSLLGVGIIILVLLCQQKGMKLLFYYWYQMIAFTDKRIQFLTEILDGIALIKVYAWEKFAFRKTKAIREKEQSFLLKALISKAAFQIGVNLAPILMFGIVFWLYSIFEGSLSLSQIFTTMTLFNLLQSHINKLIQFQNSIKNFSISVSRIENFLNSDEHIEFASKDIEFGNILIQNASFTFCNGIKKRSNGNSDLNKSPEKLDNLKKEISQNTYHVQKENNIHDKNGKSQGNESSTNNSMKLLTLSQNSNNKYTNLEKAIDSLRNVNIKLEKGQFYSVVGNVGSGKTTFLFSIMDELHLQSGKISINGKISYVSQIPWIINDTLKNNILMNELFNLDKYNEVIKLCELEEDLSHLPQGDDTLIGSKGKNLSGGQKQRVCIARALYKNSDIYLIDDCLSSSDSQVGQKIFDNVLINKLKGKTVVLVTHGIDYIKNMKNIIFINNGKIEFINNYEWLYNNCKEFRENAFRCYPENRQITVKANINNKLKIDKNFEYSSNNIQLPKQSNRNNTITKDLSKVQDSGNGKSTKGNIFNYLIFFKLGGMLFGILFMSFYLIEVGIQSFMQYLLGKWGGDKEANNSLYYIKMYCFISILFLLSDLGFHIFYIYFFKNLSNNSHLTLVKKMLRASLLWFEITPIGFILSRLSDDQNAIDRDLVWQFQIFISTALNCISSFIVISLVFPLFILIIIVTLFLYIFLYRYYYFSFKDIRSLENTFKSSIITLLTETWEGLITIRSTKITNFISQKMEERMKKLAECNLMMHHISLWISQRIDLINALILGLLSFFCIYYKSPENSPAISLALTQGLKISLLVGYLIIVLSNLDVKFDSLERVVQFTNEIIGEKRLKNIRLKPNWPSEGRISISKLSLKYRNDLPFVLHNISLEINPFEKLGIVGRTGSGKSSFMFGLMRIIEPFHPLPQNKITYEEINTPQVLIDNLNYELIDPYELRSKISIILQDPFLFIGTIKSNIDPLGSYSDQEIFECLIKTKVASLIALKIRSSETIHNPHDKSPDTENASASFHLQSSNILKYESPNSYNSEVINEHNYSNGILVSDDSSLKNAILNYEVKEKGLNFSSGEKQLISIARALIKKPRILIMDEATSSVDMNTDNLIQEMIRQEFKYCTILTIAHRIHTIIGYDRVIVLKNGRIVEIGKPLDLISNESSEFYCLFSENGKKFLEEITRKDNH